MEEKSETIKSDDQDFQNKLIELEQSIDEVKIEPALVL